MKHVKDHTLVRWCWRLLPAVLLLAVMLSADLIRPGVTAHADVRRSTPRQHFQSGGARSEVVLRDISATLKRIEASLERIEKAWIEATQEDRER